MSAMYFIDQQHEVNYKKVLFRWKHAINDYTKLEYESTCYILAIPMIFDKIEFYLYRFEYPVSWIYHYENSKILNSNNEFSLDLTNSMVHLGKLAWHLWDGNYEDFNLFDCISILEDKTYEAVKYAMDIRIGKINVANQRQLWDSDCNKNENFVNYFK